MIKSNEPYYKLTRIFDLKKIDKYRNSIIIGVLILTAIFFLIFCSEQLDIKLSLIMLMVLLTFVARYMIYFILWIQLINPFCSNKILNIFTWFFIIVSFIGVIIAIIAIPTSVFSGSKSYIINNILSFPVTVSATIGSIRFKIKNNIISERNDTTKKSKRILLISTGIILFFIVCAIAGEMGIRTSGAYKQTISYLENNTTIKQNYGEISGIGYIVTGGVEEQSKNGEWSGDANINLHFKTKKGSYSISAFLKRDNQSWQVTDYKIK